MQELKFEDSFFKGEEIEGFFVEEKMKRAWAAQMKVLCIFEDICKKHDLLWYVGYGTLLGTIRHKGFIPWDDDMDVLMPRKYYNQFRKLASKEFPKGFERKSFHNYVDHDDYIIRLVNHMSIDFSEETLEEYYGCPYAVGLDVFPIDYIPRDPKELEIYHTLTSLISMTAQSIDAGEFDYQEQKTMLSQIEKLTRQKIDRGRPITQQLRILCEQILGMFTDEDADNMGIGIRQFQWPTYNCAKENYASAIRAPFMNMEVNIPVGYENILKMVYGEDYMTPKQVVSHEYPFYKKQDELLNG